MVSMAHFALYATCEIDSSGESSQQPLLQPGLPQTSNAQGPLAERLGSSTSPGNETAGLVAFCNIDFMNSPWPCSAAERPGMPASAGNHRGFD